MRLVESFEDCKSLQSLLEKGPAEVLPQILTSPIIGGRQPNNWLNFAASAGKLDHVKLMLVSPYADDLLRSCRDYQGCTALDYAIAQKHNDIAAMLIEREAPMSLSQAYRIYNDDVLFPLFVRKKAYISHSMQANWLCAATEQGDEKRVAALLENPEVGAVLINVRGLSGRKPLEIALTTKNYNCALLLFQAGAEVEAVFAHKVFDAPALVRQIMLRYPDVPPKFSYTLPKGDNWLTYAVWRGKIDIVLMLLSSEEYKNFFLNRPGEEGLTALEWALRRNRLDVAQILLLHGAQIRSMETYKFILAYGNQDLIKSCRANKTSQIFQAEAAADAAAAAEEARTLAVYEAQQRFFKQPLDEDAAITKRLIMKSENLTDEQVGELETYYP